MSTQQQIDKLIAYQAAEWFEALKEDDEDVNAGFVQWICESPRHMEAFLLISSEAPVIRTAFAHRQFDLQALLTKISPNIASLPATTPVKAKVARTSARRYRLAGTAAALLAAVALFLYQLSWQRYETPTGEQRAIQLAEGSIVNLNAQSRVDVRFSDTRRDIRLAQGEATFKVAPDPRRPFKVYTPNALVEAVGTQFNVYVHKNGQTTVSVLEGRVRVTKRNAPPAALSAGEEAKIEVNGGIERSKQPDIAGAVAWQQRKLVFKRAALEDMAAEFNRYNKSVQIELKDIEPGAFRYTGAFDADDPQSLAVLLAREPELSVEQRGGVIVVTPRAPAGMDARR